MTTPNPYSAQSAASSFLNSSIPAVIKKIANSDWIGFLDALSHLEGPSSYSAERPNYQTKGVSFAFNFPPPCHAARVLN